MKKVRWAYTRDTHVRVIRKADFANLGVPVEEDMTFSKENQFTVLMSDEACDALTSKLPTEFVAVNELQIVDGEARLVGSSDADSSSDRSADSNPDGSSSESEGAATGDGDESSPAKRRNR